MGDIIICYGGTFEAVNARIGSAWKKLIELKGVLVGKHGLYLKQQGKMYQNCVGPVFVCFCGTWGFTVADKARLRGVECSMIRMICEMILVDRVSTDVLRDRVGVVVKIEDMII